MNEDVRYTLSLNDLLIGKLREADGAATKLEGTMSGVQSILGALGVAGGIAGIVAFGKQMIDAGTKVEDARVGLTTLLKDANEAGRVIDNTMQDATKTPFAFEGLLSANKALISAGENADGARETVLNLANAIAATGGGDDELQRMVVNLQQIKNTGKATALDIKQFAYAGINVYKVLDEAGVKYAKGQEITYTQITEALKKAHDKGGIYFNGLENMAGNTSVQISNLGDSMFQLSVKMFDDLKPAISGVISALQNSIQFLSTHGKELKAIAFGLTTGAVAYGVYTLAINASTIATSLMTGAQWLLNAAMEANPIGFVIAGIAALSAAIFYAYEKVSWFHAGMWALWETIKTVGGMIGNAMLGLGKIIMGVLLPNPSQIKEGWQQMTSAFEDAGAKIAGSWSKGYANGMADFAGKNTTGQSKKVAKVGVPGAEGAKGKDISAKGATGTKAITINIEIGKLIETFKIETTNLAQSTGKIQEMITNTLLQAVNDASITADI